LALFGPAVSSFTIPRIACITRCALARSGSASISGSALDTICHDTPWRSLNQPHRERAPPELAPYFAVLDREAREGKLWPQGP
jgi:hypothetical protein